jgi:dCMP deaminase
MKGWNSSDWQSSGFPAPLKKGDGMKGWDQYFVEMAQHAATKSKDRSTKVGAVIVGDGHNVISVGFNGFPRGVNDDVEARHERPVKYLVTEHAERNSIYNCARHGVRTAGATLYLNGGGWPCADCARAIIQAGIVEVVAMAGKFEGKGGLWEESCRVGKEMLEEAGVKLVQLDPEYNRL